VGLLARGHGRHASTDGRRRLLPRTGEDERFVPGGPPLIVVRADAASHTMVVEGHGRIVAAATHPEELPPQLEVLLGEGASIREWSLY